MVYKGLLITLRLIVLHSLLAVADSGGRRVCDYTEYSQHREQRVNHRRKLIAYGLNMQLVAEHRRYYLREQKQRGDEREPEYLVFNTNLPIDFHN